MATPGAGIGLFSIDRLSSADFTFYWNGANQATQSAVSAIPDGLDMRIGDLASGFATSSTISAAVIGGSLGSAGNLALYTRLRAYMTSIGVP